MHKWSVDSPVLNYHQRSVMVMFFGSICLSVCLSVCMWYDNFRKSWRWKFVFDQHRMWRSSGQSKAIRSKKARNSRNAKLWWSAIKFGSIRVEDAAVKFACSVAFFAMVNQNGVMPSLSRDRTWPSLTKYTHSRPVCLRLEGNLVNTTFLTVFIGEYFYADQKETYGRPNNGCMLSLISHVYVILWTVVLFTVTISTPGTHTWRELVSITVVADRQTWSWPKQSKANEYTSFLNIL